MPTSRSRQPDRAMMSGMRKAPPISMSSPREVGTSLPRARLLRTRSTAAALLFTTVAASAPVRRQSCSFEMIVAVAAPPRSEIVFEIAGRAGGGCHSFDRLAREHGAAEIGVEHRAGQVEHRPQRRYRLIAQLLRHTLDDGCFADSDSTAFRPQLGEHGPDDARDRRPAVLLDQRDRSVVAQQTIDRGKVHLQRMCAASGHGRRNAFSG